jgi:hypothetical protein
MIASTPLDWTWSLIVPHDPTRFYPRFGPIPAVFSVREQEGPWGTVGQTRKLLLSDGGYVVETITDVEPESYFAYELSSFQRGFKQLVDSARAEWFYIPQPEGTLVRWTYTFVPKRGRAWLVRLIVRLWWGRYMHSVLPELVHEAERLAP